MNCKMGIKNVTDDSVTQKSNDNPYRSIIDRRRLDERKARPYW